MNTASMIVLTLVIVSLAAAVFFTVKNRGKSPCSGCSGCHAGCKRK